MREHDDSARLHKQGQFSLVLMESLVRVLRLEIGGLVRQLANLLLDPTDRLILRKALLGTEPLPDELQEDIDLVSRISEATAVARSIDDSAESLLAESKQLWQTVEYKSGNVQKVSFDGSRKSGQAGAPPCSTAKVQHLLTLALQLVERSSELHEALIDLEPRIPGGLTRIS
jgi:hypothetical protein